jgi:hypothetical protein
MTPSRGSLSGETPRAMITRERLSLIDYYMVKPLVCVKLGVVLHTIEL